MDFILNADIAVLLFIQQSLKNTFFDFIMPIVTLLAEGGIIPIAISVLLMCFKKTRKNGFKMALALSLGLIIGNLCLKPLVARIRPYEAIEGVRLLVSTKSDFSFPSGHTLASFECAGVVALNYRKYAFVSILLACVVAFSRIYIGVHYPTDVLAGALMGTLFAYAGHTAVERVIGQKQSSYTHK